MSFEQPNPPETVPNAPQEYANTPYANTPTEYQNPPQAYANAPQRYQTVRVSPVERTCQIVYLVFGIIEVLILIRILLKLLAANPDAGFSSFMYGITDPFVAFFEGVFSTPASRGSVLELSSVLAIIVYALLAYLIVRVVRLLSSRRQTPGAI